MTVKLARCGAAFVLCWLGAGLAMGQSSPYYLGVAQSIGYESNLYRVSDSLVLAPDISKDDTLYSTSLVGGVDQTFGRQRIHGSGNLRSNRFARNKLLNNESYGLKLALDWATVDRLSGSLSMSSDQNLAKFTGRNISNGQPETQRNEVRTHDLDAKVRLGVVTRYTLEASLGHRRRDYSAPDYQDREFRQTHASLGARWRPGGALSLGMALRLTRINYPQFATNVDGSLVADRIKRQDIDLTATWQPSAVSQFSGRLSPTRTRHDRTAANDYSGVTGSANWVWQPTGKTRLVTTLSRDSGQSADAITVGIFTVGVTDDSRTTTALAWRGTHDLTGKVSLNAGITLAHRSLRTDQLLVDGSRRQARGNDKVNGLSLGALWLPTRSTQLGCDIGTETKRSSNLALSTPYRSDSVSCYGQFVLQ